MRRTLSPASVHPHTRLLSTAKGLFLEHPWLGRQRLMPFTRAADDATLDVASGRGWVRFRFDQDSERDRAEAHLERQKRSCRLVLQTGPHATWPSLLLALSALTIGWLGDAVSAGATAAVLVVAGAIVWNRRTLIVGTDALFVGWSLHGRPLFGRLFQFEDVRNLSAKAGMLTLEPRRGRPLRITIAPETEAWRMDALKEVLRRQVAYETARAAATFETGEEERISNPSLPVRDRIAAASTLATRSRSAAGEALSVAATGAVCPQVAEALQRAAGAFSRSDSSGEHEITPRPVR